MLTLQNYAIFTICQYNILCHFNISFLQCSYVHRNDNLFGANYHKCRSCVAAKLLTSAAPITVKAFKRGVTAAQHLTCLL